MAIHKLDLDEFDEIDYHLIAIHTTLEDYRLAYFINQHLPVNLSKSNEEILISIKEGETQFSRFYFDDEDNFVSWNLIQNKNEVVGQNEIINQDLFSNSSQVVATKVFLLPELKKVEPASEGLAILAAMIAGGTLKPRIEIEANWTEIGAVARQLLYRSFMGKAVLHLS